MNIITYIEDPLFVIDFKQFASQNITIEDQKIKRFALDFFHVLHVISSSTIKAIGITFYYSGTSFKRIVLGFYGSWSNFQLPADIYLIIFKIMFWVFNLGWSTAKTSIRLTMQELFPKNSAFLTMYAMKGIDVKHIYTNDFAINMSEVEAHVKVNDLMQIYEKIDFKHQDLPNYMSPASRVEDKVIYSVHDLKDGLEKFITRVNNRVPFLGTPSGNDTDLLMVFYQKIENAVRFSIDASNKQIAAFQAENGIEEAEYDDSTKEKYRNLLEDRARIAIDLAIAGKHCGARYLAESQVVYKNMRGDKLGHKGSLKDCLIELLANKRYEIASAEIARHLIKRGKSIDSTHAYNKYMASLGKILGLPGTEDIVEVLDRNLNLEKLLSSFFHHYTVDVIIETIQQEASRSQIFREKITDWLKDQEIEWKKEQYQREAQELVPAVLQAMNDSVDEDNSQWVLFCELIQQLQQSDEILLPDVKNGWNEFITELFTLDSVRQWRNDKFPEEEILPILRENDKNFDALQPMQQNTKVLSFRQAEMEKLKAVCVMQVPSPAVFTLLQNQSKNEILAELTNHFAFCLKIEQVRKILPLEVDTIARIMLKSANEREEQIKQAIMALKDLERHAEFLAQIAKGHIKEDILEEANAITPEKKEYPLSPALIEWLTVSQGIFTPQEGDE